MIAGLIVIAAALLMIYAVVRGVRARGETVAEPACGACRYPVHGLATMICPECGADFRRVGIRVPSPPRGPTHVAWLVASWAFLVILVAVPSTAVIGSYPGFQTETARVSLNLSGAAGRLPAVPNVQVTIRTENDRWLLVEYMAISRGSGAVVVLRREGDLWTVANDDGRSVPGTAPSPEVFTAFLRAAGADPAAEATVAGAADLAGIADASGRAPPYQVVASGQGLSAFRLVGSSRATSRHTSEWLVGTALVVWGLVWLAGARLIVRGHRRAVAEADRRDEGALAAAYVGSA